MDRYGLTKQPTRIVLTTLFGLGLSTMAQAFDVSDEQREACTPDAFRLCSTEIPDVPRVTACMEANRARLSPACRAVFQAMDSTGASPAPDAPKTRRAAKHHRHHYYADYDR